LPNRLTMPTSDVRFVGSGENAVFDFTLSPADPGPNLELVHGGLLYDGLASQVAVVLSTYYIDELGLVVARPVPDTPVLLASSGDVQTWPAEGVTAADGSVAINVECRATAGPAETGPDEAAEADDGQGEDGAAQTQVPPSGTLTATAASQVASFPLPGCLPIPDVDQAAEGSTSAGGDVDG
jgi:hypothetical protein